jgi:hypothetical protein
MAALLVPIALEERITRRQFGAAHDADGRAAAKPVPFRW